MTEASPQQSDKKPRQHCGEPCLTGEHASEGALHVAGPHAADKHSGRGPSPTGTLDYLLSVIDGRPGIGAACIRAGLRALSWLYWLGLKIELATYVLGMARVTRLPVEVIAVGNLSMGGTGKTLATLRLARKYLAAGRRVAILSRGHGRASRDERIACFTPETGAPEPREVGDEPSLLAVNLPGVPVLIGKNRRRTGQRAIDEFGADLLILDDGFQYWRLFKDHEIVLIDAMQPKTREALLPRGLLREPWTHLRWAHEVWITHAQLAPPAGVRRLARCVAAAAPQALIRFTEHQPRHLRAPQGDVAPLEILLGRQVLALSGLGNPRQFELMLSSLGAEVTPCRYPDHHRFTEDDIAAIAARLAPKMPVITTAKDAVRLPASLPFPVWIVEVELIDVPPPDGLYRESS